MHINDPATRSKLETKGELVIAKPGAVAKLETNTLRLQARIVDMAYGSGPLPPNSYFDKMTIEIQAWRKSPSEAPVAAAPASAAAVLATITVRTAAALPTFAPRCLRYQQAPARITIRADKRVTT